MGALFSLGLMIYIGFIFGEVATRLRLPRITGYIVAGLFLHLEVFAPIFANLEHQTEVITEVSLAVIAFSVGGALLYRRFRELGRGIISIAIFESLVVFIVVVLGFFAVSWFFAPAESRVWSIAIPISVLLASLGAPTDPSATLAIKHEYDVQGEVSATIMGVAGIDDIMGIIFFSLGTGLARAFTGSGGLNITALALDPAVTILSSLAVGVAFGFLLNLVTVYVTRDTEGVLIVLVLGLLLTAYGAAALLGLDELLAIMVMGLVVVNYNPLSKKIFALLERYIEELVFVLFFVLSSLHLDFSVLVTSFVLIISFVILRAAGKIIGTWLGAAVGRASDKVKKYAAGGLIPQGGIVIGLALLIRQDPALREVATVVLNVIIGSAIIHEFVGPLVAKAALARAGELGDKP